MTPERWGAYQALLLYLSPDGSELLGIVDQMPDGQWRARTLKSYVHDWEGGRQQMYRYRHYCTQWMEGEWDRMLEGEPE